MSAQMKAVRVVGRDAVAGQRAARGTAERRRAAPNFRFGAGDGASSGPITLSVMRSMVAAADALRGYLSAFGGASLTMPDLESEGNEVADLVRHYQAASRLFVKEWLRDRRRTTWLVETASGRTLHPGRAASAAPADQDDGCVASLAAEQKLHGLRDRFTREGVGIPLVVRSRGSAEELDIVRGTAARARTAVVRVEPDADRRVRTVRVTLHDPARVESCRIGAVALPLAADFTAPVAQTLGLGHKPAAIPYSIRDTERRGTIDGFTALTPFAPDTAPLILMEGVGLSPLTMAQIANEVAGDSVLRERYQVWLYRYPTTAPLLFAARTFRADLERLYSRLDAAADRPVPGHGMVAAQGAASAIARSVIAESGSAIWDAVFTTPLAQLNVTPTDRVFLESLFFWKPFERLERAAVVGVETATELQMTGVGDRAVQLLQRQSPRFRSMIERIYGNQKQHLRTPPLDAGLRTSIPADSKLYAEPVCEALANAALMSDRAILTLADSVARSDRAEASPIAP